MLDQNQQDRIWQHQQDQVAGAFDLSYPRLRFLAERCAPRTRVLNIGVGGGYLEEVLVSRGIEAFALDPSASTVERLRQTLKMGERARQGYSQDIPFPSEYFDKVIMTEVLEHLPDEILAATLAEVRRVLRPNGEFTGTVPYREDLSANEVICPHCQSRFHRWGHEQAFDVRRLSEMLKEHGFRVRRACPRAFPDFRRPRVTFLLKAVFRYVLGRMGEPIVGPNIYFRAVRTE